MKKKKNKNEVIKHSSSIQITNRINLIERKSWNILLANAFDELPSQETHSIRIKELANLLEYDSNDEEHLKEALRKLNTVQIEWNILNKDKKRSWGVTTLLAQAEFEEGVCIYAFSPVLRERLYNPEMYAKISLLAQNKIKSKYSLALYEIFLDYLNNKQNYGETPLMSIEKFRELLGLEEQEYKIFKRLNYEVIKPSIREINNVTNLSIKFNLEKAGRKVIGIKFFITKAGSDDLINFEQLSLLEPRKEKLSKFKSKKIKDFCKDNKLSHELLKDPRTKHGEEYIEYVIHSCQNAKNIKSLSGFFMSAIRNQTFLEQYELLKEGRREAEKKKLRELEEKINDRVLLVYSSEEEIYIKQFFQNHEELFFKILEKQSKKNKLIEALAIRADKDFKKLLHNQAILHSFYNEIKSHNDYLFPSFKDWQKDPENEEKVSTIRKKLLV